MTALPPLDEAGFGAMLDGAMTADAIAATLGALADRGETADEISAAARAMRHRMRRINAPDGAIDVCGTGGDGQHSLNVSTAVALVVAACDVPVAKHGNRAASSMAGAADTLAALGLDLDRASARAEHDLEQFGICFLFAPHYHPALTGLAPIRKALGRRTIFNLLGPLCNPAGVARQMIGVAHPSLLDRYAAAIATLGTDATLVVSGDEGLDELSPAGPSSGRWIVGDAVSPATFSATDAGLQTHPLMALRGGDAQHNAAALVAMLRGDADAPQLLAYRDAVLLNAAAALMVAGHVATMRDGAEEAAEAIDKGLAFGLLQCWVNHDQ